MPQPIPQLIRNSLRERIDFTYHPGAADNTTLVLIGHGVTGNKDRPLVIELAQALAQAGIHALRFSYTGNGDSEGQFAACTVSKEVGDLGALLDALPGWRIGYAGHSMGAAVGVQRASRDARIQFLISLAGMVHTADFARREFGGVTPGTGCMWDKPECPLSQVYWDDMNRIGSVLPAARQIRVPWLLVHGTVDDVVPVQDSHDLVAGVKPPPHLVEPPGADHVFSDGHARAMAGAVVEWVGRLPR